MEGSPAEECFWAIFIRHLGKIEEKEKMALSSPSVLFSFFNQLRRLIRIGSATYT